MWFQCSQRQQGLLPPRLCALRGDHCLTLRGRRKMQRRKLKGRWPGAPFDFARKGNTGKRIYKPPAGKISRRGGLFHYAAAGLFTCQGRRMLASSPACKSLKRPLTARPPPAVFFLTQQSPRAGSALRFYCVQRSLMHCCFVAPMGRAGSSAPAPRKGDGPP